MLLVCQLRVREIVEVELGEKTTCLHPYPFPCHLFSWLNKSLYGLKQASRNWFTRFSHVIQQISFVQSKVDYSLFTRANGNAFTAVLIHVDDILVTRNSIDEINSLKTSLRQKFHIKDLDNLKYFFGHLSLPIPKSNLHFSMQICLGYFERCRTNRCQT